MMTNRQRTRTETRVKLNDAVYWLGRLRHIRRNPDIFRRTLDAFLAAARSVIDFMGSEYEGVPGSKQWQTHAWDNLMRDRDVAFLFAARNRAIHRQLRHKPMRPAYTHAQINATFHDYLTLTDSVSVTPVYADGTIGPTMTSPPPEPVPQRESEATIEHVWVFDEVPDTDVVTLCAHLLAELDATVAACEACFTPKP